MHIRQCVSIFWVRVTFVVKIGMSNVTITWNEHPLMHVSTGDIVVLGAVSYSYDFYQSINYNVENL